MIKTHRNPALLTDSLLGNFNEIMNEILSEQKVAAHTPHQGVAINLTEKENGYEILASLPGLTRESIEVNITDHLLTICGTPQAQPATDSEKLHIKEIRNTPYKRVIKLPKNTDTNNVDATYEHGILTLHLTKKKEALPKIIEIK